MEANGRTNTCRLRGGIPTVAMAVGILLCEAGLTTASGAERPPDTPKKPVTDQYHGVTVTDDYQWLENSGDTVVRNWVTQENLYARAILDQLQGREAIGKRLEGLHHNASSQYYGLEYRGGLLFALKSQPPKEQPLLVSLRSANDPGSERVLLDVTALNPAGTTTIDFYVPSRDGKLVAVSLSEGGSEDGTVHVYDLAKDRELPDTIPRVNGATAGGSVAWNADGSGFYYTRYPRGKERPKEDVRFFQQVYFHRLGTPTSKDTYSIGKDFPRIAEIDLETSEDGRFILASVANGDGGDHAHYILTPEDGWKQVTRFEDKVSRMVLAPDNSVFLLSTKDAPTGKILRLPPGATDLARAATIVPADTMVIQSFVPTAAKIYVRDLIGGPSQLRVFDYEGHAAGAVPVKPVSSVGGLVPIGGDTVMLSVSSYLQPSAWYTYLPESGELRSTALIVTSPADFSDVEVVREFATSKDGTRIPMNILRRKGTTLDGNNPTLLTGYGGFNISLSPGFDATRSIWLDQGGVLVIANLRGGSEYGEKWHLAGNLTNKQNVFDDFAACAEHLIKSGYTNPKKLAIQGGSNGGLLMGAALTQHPDIFRAVVARAGYYDMLRFERDPNGVFNAVEYGSVNDSAQFAALYAYSPYHHVEIGRSYPAILFLTGEHDGRVNPSHSRKFAAKLQAVTGPDGRVLLRISTRTGHGAGTALSEQIAQETDVFTFLFDELGVQYQPHESTDK
jgi:prolyl oligopeptidase